MGARIAHDFGLYKQSQRRRQLRGAPGAGPLSSCNPPCLGPGTGHRPRRQDRARFSASALHWDGSDTALNVVDVDDVAAGAHRLRREAGARAAPMCRARTFSGAGSPHVAGTHRPAALTSGSRGSCSTSAGLGPRAVLQSPLEGAALSTMSRQARGFCCLEAIVRSAVRGQRLRVSAKAGEDRRTVPGWAPASTALISPERRSRVRPLTRPARRPGVRAGQAAPVGSRRPPRLAARPGPGRLLRLAEGRGRRKAGGVDPNFHHHDHFRLDQHDDDLARRASPGRNVAPCPCGAASSRRARGSCVAAEGSPAWQSMVPIAYRTRRGAARTSSWSPVRTLSLVVVGPLYSL